MDSSNQPTLMVIDGHSLAFRAFYALPLDSFVTPEGQHTNAIHGFLSMLLSLLKKEQPSHLVVAFDVSRYSFRTREYPEYKATRGETPAEFVGQIPLLQTALDAMGVHIVRKEDFEADDILATLATQGEQAGFRVLVVSGDRDTLQLVTPEVTVLYPSARGVSELKRYTPEAVFERYGVPPASYPDIAALVGETSDNLIGIDKVGEKTAVKWITQYGSLSALLAHAEDIPGVVGANLREQQDRAVRNRALNALVRDVDLPVRPEDLERQDINVEAVKEIFGQLRFRTLTERVLTLAGDQSNSAPSATPSSATPTPRALLDEELDHWLEKHPDVLSIVVQATPGGLLCGLSDGHELITVAHTRGSHDADPLQKALREPGRKWWWLHAKEDLHTLHGAGWQVGPRIDGDLRVASWMTSPGRKIPSLAQLVEEVLGELSVASDPNALLDATDQGVVDAWWLHRVYPAVRDGLPETQRVVYEELELPLIPILWRMEQLGIASDRAALEALDATLLAEAAEHQRRAFDAIGHEVNLGSPKQLQGVLFEQLGMPKTRQTKTGYSTDQQALADLQQSNPHPFLDALLGHRDQTKLHQIVEGLATAVGEDGRLHTTFDQTGTSTGRLSSLEPNLQNIPARTEIGHRR